MKKKKKLICNRFKEKEWIDINLLMEIKNIYI